MDKLKQLKLNIREADFPMFTDETLSEYLAENKGDVRKTSYQLLILKAENTGLSTDGLTTKDSASYFKMLASCYTETNSGVLS